jgi:asparagine synthetase B (glutamine-hydrolysing)
VLSKDGEIVSTGLNAAILMARGEYVLRMDAHSSYSRDYVRRLSLIDLRTGHQPLTNEDGSVVVVFNREIYNFASFAATWSSGAMCLLLARTPK